MLSYVFGHIASYPRQRYSRDGHDLDLSFITPSIAAMSLPAKRPIEQLYRNHIADVRRFLDSTGRDWRVFEFRGEGAGYDDAEDFDGRVSHFPFVDHHPPPFAVLPRIVADMHAHLRSAGAGAGAGADGGLCVLHCKAGKGRSGLAACSYLVSHTGLSAADARALFTRQRMRRGFGEGLSIPSQVRYLGYLDRWAATRKSNVSNEPDDATGVYDSEYSIDVTHIDVEDMVQGSRLALRRFADAGKKLEVVCELDSSNCTITKLPRAALASAGPIEKVAITASSRGSSTASSLSQDTAKRSTIRQGGGEGPVTRYTLNAPQRMPADVGLYLSRGSGWMHCWFNAFFEDGLESASAPGSQQKGKFEIDWDSVDGWKGTTFLRGRRCFERVAVHWTPASASASAPESGPTSA